MQGLEFDRHGLDALLEGWSEAGQHTNVVQVVAQLQVRTAVAARCLARALSTGDPVLRRSCVNELERFGAAAALAGTGTITAAASTLSAASLPGAGSLTSAAVQEAWRRVFTHNPRLRVRVSQLAQVQGPFTAVHSVIEHIGVGTDVAQAPVVATNVYARGAMGWRLLVHHASAAPPDTGEEVPKILH